MDERPFRSQYAPRSPIRQATPPPSITEPDEAPKEPPKKKSRKKRIVATGRTHWWKILLAIVVVVGVAFFVQNYVHTRNQLKKLSDTKTATQASDQELINQVSPYVVLPQGETPTVATVNDVSKLRGQVFFQNAQNGDKVLIFPQAKTAILYRPSVKKIVEYAPISVDANTTSSGATTSTTGQ